MFANLPSHPLFLSARFRRAEGAAGFASSSAGLAAAPLRGGPGRVAARLPRAEVVTGRAEKPGASRPPSTHLPSAGAMGRVPVAQPGDPDPRSREAVAGREGHVRRKTYYLSRGCGAKEAAAFPSRNGRGGGGGGGKCGGGGGGRRGG